MELNFKTFLEIDFNYNYFQIFFEKIELLRLNEFHQDEQKIMWKKLTPDQAWPLSCTEERPSEKLASFIKNILRE